MNALNEHPIIRQYIEWNKFGSLLGMQFEIVEPGKVMYKMSIRQMHLATPFAAHGGSVAALMDAALGVAALSKVCQDNLIVSTVSLQVQYMHPAFLDDELTVTAEVTKAGKRLLFVDAKIVNQKGQMIGSGTATMNAYPVAKADYSK
jgi:uncharacterized protein (TIGR00369 family)